MLHLQAGVHFQKVKTLVLADHKFDCARALVLHRLSQQHGLLAHGFARGLADERTGRLFNHFLVAALNRALTLVQVNHVAMAVTDQLNLNMAWLFNEFFNEDTVVTKAVFGLITATGETLESFLVVEGDAQAFATAASAGFDHHRVANALCNLYRFLGGFDGIVDPRDAVDTSSTSQLLGLDLVAHGGNRVMLGANEDQAFFFHPLGKASVFTQKSVARVHGFGAGLFAGGNDFFCLQITVTTGCRADVHRFVSQLNMARIFVGIGVHRHRFDAHLAGCKDDAAGDFATVGDQDFVEHGLSFDQFLMRAHGVARSAMGAVYLPSLMSPGLRPPP